MAKKNGKPRARVYPAGLEDEFPNGPPTVVIEHHGLKLVLRFDPGDLRGEGPVREIRLEPDSQPLEPGALKYLPSAAMYFNHARKAMRILGGEGSTEQRWQDFRNSLAPFRKIAGPGRGLSDPFYRLLGNQHKVLVNEGEQTPVKAIAAIHDVTISAASKWLKEARRRGYLEEDA